MVRIPRSLTHALMVFGMVMTSQGSWAQPPATAVEEPRSTRSADRPAAPASSAGWELGCFLDIGYLNSFNSPSNHLFRSRGTTPRVDELTANMGGGYTRKRPSEQSRWGLELTAHAGEDAKLFGFSATAPNIKGAKWLRHLGPTNVSYVAPIGKGLVVQGGIFNSFIGYDSLYSKDNFTYTRPWAADFTPYLMLGVNAGYAFSDTLTATAFVINGYWHLAHANDVPSVGGQLAVNATRYVTVKHTILYGPHQPNTSLTHWRVLSDTIVERKTGQLTIGAEFQVSTEAVDAIGKSRALWVAAQVPMHWTFGERWSVSLRPEFAWDRDGRWTTFQQSVAAMTSTFERRVPFRAAQAMLRLEHRYDNSRGQGGGFFKDVSPGVVGVTPGQHLLVFGLILRLDTSSR